MAEFLYMGDHTKGEIEIIEDLTTIPIEQLNNIGPLGVVYEDKYIRLIKDAVIFPNKQIGSYIRLSNTKLSRTGSSGSAVIAVANGKILLINLFRHALRRRSLEIPRGFSEGDFDMDTAVREVREETGYSPTRVQLIGHMNPDSGISSSQVSIYYAELDIANRSKLDELEATEEQGFYSKEELLGLITRGRITDSFTLAAITLATSRGFI